jgi:hypothetical protein
MQRDFLYRMVLQVNRVVFFASEVPVSGKTRLARLPLASSTIGIERPTGRAADIRPRFTTGGASPSSAIFRHLLHAGLSDGVDDIECRDACDDQTEASRKPSGSA